jgi:hypothetical protein
VPTNEGLTRLRSRGGGALCSLAAATRAMWAWMRADATLGHTPRCALVVAAIHAVENSSPSADTHDSSLPAFIIVRLRNTEAASRHRPCYEADRHNLLTRLQSVSRLQSR